MLSQDVDDEARSASPFVNQHAHLLPSASTHASLALYNIGELDTFDTFLLGAGGG